MAKKTKEIRTFKADKPSAKAPPVAKIVIVKMPVEAIRDEFDARLKEVRDAGLSPKFGRGVVTLY